jgi:hypothetical protein
MALALFAGCGPSITDTDGSKGGSGATVSDDSTGDMSGDSATGSQEMGTTDACTAEQVQGCADPEQCIVKLVREVVVGPDGPCTEVTELAICVDGPGICSQRFVNYRHLPTGRCFMFRSDCSTLDRFLWGQDEECPPQTFPDCS